MRVFYTVAGKWVLACFTSICPRSLQQERGEGRGWKAFRRLQRPVKCRVGGLPLANSSALTQFTV